MSLHLFSYLHTSRVYRALAVAALVSAAACALSASPAAAQPVPTTISTALSDGTNVGPKLTEPPGNRGERHGYLRRRDRRRCHRNGDL